MAKKQGVRNTAHRYKIGELKTETTKISDESDPSRERMPNIQKILIHLRIPFPPDGRVSDISLRKQRRVRNRGSNREIAPGAHRTMGHRKCHRDRRRGITPNRGRMGVGPMETIGAETLRNRLRETGWNCASFRIRMGV